MATRYSSRPSEVLGIEDGWLAYQVDTAALLLGLRVEALTWDGKMTVSAALEKITAERQADAGTRFARGHGDAGQYRDPRPYVTRKVQVRPDGTWD